MTIDLLIVILCGFSIILLGLFVILRDPTQKQNLRFGIMSLANTCWVLTNYFSTVNPTNLMLFRSTYFAGLLTAIILISFISVFPRDITGNPLIKRLLLGFYLVAPIMLVLIFSPWFIDSVSEQSAHTSFIYPIFILFMFISFLLILKFVFMQNKVAKTKEEKKQLKIVSVGLIVFGLLALLLNVAIPTLTSSWTSSRFGPVAALVLVGTVAYAIAKHRLFDIKLIVARSVAYVLSLGFIGFTYGFTAFYLIDEVFFHNTTMPLTTRRIVYISLAVLFGLIYAPVKKVFDKFSNKLFYRDTYDSQVFIDALTNILVSNTDITKLFKESSALINTSLKSAFTEFVLKDGAYDKKSWRGKVAHSMNKELQDNIMMLAEISEDKVLVVDDLERGRNRSIAKALKARNVALIIKLSNREALIGLVLIGVKKSGNIYNRQDKEVFDIVSDELSLAIENSLSYEEIRRFNETLKGEVEDATKQLRHSNEKLKALDETKDEFISMASHQLRTPLTSVKGYLSMVLEGDAGELNEQQKKLLTQAFISSQRMVYLIADLLNVSRLRTGKFEIETKPTYLPDIVEAEVSQLYETAEAKGLELTFDKPKDFPKLELDETKVRQVIMNFTDNAIYYTPKGGKIKVELEFKPKTIEFRVTDNGLGVPKAEQHQLFTKFYRANNARRVRPDGTGLGLFMARKVVIAQGGAIIFRSTEGKGSTFGFTFPRHKLEVKSLQNT